jgi:hypothetical protein
MKTVVAALFCLFLLRLEGFSQKDSTVLIDHKSITLSEVVIRSNINVASFINKVKQDTSFYKAFRNLRVLNFTALNDIRMLDKKGGTRASLNSRTQQKVWNGCRITTTIEEKSEGDIYDKSHHFNYYTAELYASLMFAFDTVCGETNVVGNAEQKINSSSGIEKHKEQLKMLFFNPGKRIPGVPFIGNKVAIFDDEMAPLYDYFIDLETHQGQECYVFRVQSKKDLSSSQRNDIVIDQMTTWFSHDNFDILGRSYSLSYHAGVYDFDVEMEVELMKFGDWLVPTLIRYNGNWGLIFRRRERGVFTATLFDFKSE